jgi:hypothetical protein
LLFFIAAHAAYQKNGNDICAFTAEYFPEVPECPFLIEAYPTPVKQVTVFTGGFKDQLQWHKLII